MFEEKIEKYIDGRIKTITRYENGVRNGLEIGFHHNGNIKYTIPYLNDKYNGIIRGFFEDGTKCLVSYFDNDVVKSEITWTNSGIITSFKICKEDGMNDGYCIHTIWKKNNEKTIQELYYL